MARIGIIGGSGLYEIEGLEIKQMCRMRTPFGSPSGEFVIGSLSGKEVVFLPRHGKKHLINPSQINYRANIFGMKKLGVERIISVSACGSLRENIKPLDFVIPFQFVDKTNQSRKCTFFEDGITAHVSLAHPICEELAGVLANAAKKMKQGVHVGGTYLNMEGPQFSTLAESNLYRSWGMDVIGMTNMSEARLAREAEICYVSLVAVTDYDCWHETEEAVSVDVIVENLRKNTENAKKILKDAITRISDVRNCACKDALKYAIITDLKAVSKKTKGRLGILIDKYMRNTSR